eukprot:8631026-Lingulodinium_polyedra.AAC.1
MPRSHLTLASRTHDLAPRLANTTSTRAGCQSWGSKRARHRQTRRPSHAWRTLPRYRWTPWNN